MHSTTMAITPHANRNSVFNLIFLPSIDESFPTLCSLRRSERRTRDHVLQKMLNTRPAKAVMAGPIIIRLRSIDQKSLSIVITISIALPGNTEK